MSQSNESQRPMLKTQEANRSSMRVSTYSLAGSDVTDAELRDFKERLRRLDDQRMDSQRYQPSQQKMDEQSKLALVGKVQKSLERRYHNQDATMKPRVVPQISEKA